MKARITSRSRLLGAGLVAVAMVASACGSDDSGDSSEPAPSAEDTVAVADEPATASADEGGDGPRVALLFDVTGRGDKGYADSAAAGLDAATAEHPGIIATESESKNGGNDLPDRMTLQVDNENDLIIAVGFSWTDEVAKQAENSPGTNFALVDAVVDAPNVASLLFNEYQGSYLAGVAAALTTQTGKLGFIGGVESDLIRTFEAGFRDGAESVDPDIEVETKFISQPPDFSGFNDPQRGKEIASAMYSADADIVYHAAGASGAGLFQAAEESDKSPGEIWAIGVNVDEALVVPEEQRPYILTSMLKNVDVAVKNTIDDQVAGNFSGGVKVFDLANGGIDLATTDDHLADILGQINDVRDALISGEIPTP